MRNPPPRRSRIPDGLYVYHELDENGCDTSFLITVIDSRPDKNSSDATYDWYRCTVILPGGRVIGNDILCVEELEEVDL